LTLAGAEQEKKNQAKLKESMSSLKKINIGSG
jgi:hypothetical protein